MPKRSFLESIKTKIPEIRQKWSVRFEKMRKSFIRIYIQFWGISKEFIRSPSSILWTILFPIIMILIFGALFGRTIDTTYHLAVLDLDDSAESRAFCSYLDANTSLSIQRLNDSSIEPRNWLIKQNKRILLVIPENWTGKINTSTPSNLTLYLDPTSSSAETIHQIINQVVLELNFQLNEVETPIGIQEENFYVEELTFIDSFVPGVIMIIIATSGFINGISNELHEKETGIRRKFATTPVNKIERVVAKQLWQILLALASSIIVILFALIFNFKILTLHPLMLIMLIFGTMTFSGLSKILVSIIDNPDGVMFASMLIILPQIFLCDVFIPLDNMPRFLQFLARIFPLYYLSEGMQTLILKYTFSQFWYYFFMAGSFALGFFVVGTMITKWKKE